MDGLSFEVLPGLTINQPELPDFHSKYFRSNFGDYQNVVDTLYQHYLSGGWAEVDAEVLSELQIWDDYNAEPLIIFMYGGNCVVPTKPQLAAYGDFIVAFVTRYNIDYFEVWNEPDSSGGFPSLYGCFGVGYADRLNYLLGYVNSRTSKNVGVSFAFGSQAGFDMFTAVAGSADWIGLHHYAVWGGGQVLETWPGSIETLYQMVLGAINKPVWITEVNLRSPGDECGTEHQISQSDYLQNALTLGAPVTSILVYADYPNWQCSGIRGTIAAQDLLGYPAPPP